MEECHGGKPGANNQEQVRLIVQRVTLCAAKRRTRSSMDGKYRFSSGIDDLGA